MALEYANITHAMAKVLHTAAGAGPCTFVSNSGFTVSTSTHAATGLYVLPLDQPVDPAGAVACAFPTSGTDATAFAVVTGSPTGSSITAHVLEAGALSDANDFGVVVWAQPNQA